MQGRLTKPPQGLIQYFPVSGWKNEFNLASRLDFKVMEWTLDNHPFESNPILCTSHKEVISDLCAKHKINLPSITCDCFMQNPLWVKQNASQNKNRLDLVLEACKVHSISILVVPLVDNSRITSAEQVIDMKKLFSDFSSFMKKTGIQLAFETDLNPRHTSEFLEDFDHELFGINYDIGNSASCGFDFNEEFFEYGDRIINVHVKDRKLGGETVPLGDGSANLQGAIKGLVDLGYTGNYILQTARCYDGRDAEVLSDYQKITLAYLSSAYQE